MKGNCELCGREIIKTSHNRKYCRNCRKIKEKEWSKKRWKKKSAMKKTFCRNCGIEIKKGHLYCKNCLETRQKEKRKIYNKKAEKRIKKYMKIYRKENNEKLKDQKKIWNEKNKYKIRKLKKEWVKKNPDKVQKAREKEKIKRKKTNYNQKPQVKKSKLKWKKKNRGYGKKYYEENKKDLLKKQNKYEKIKMKEDKNFSIQKRLRHSLRVTLKNYTKTGKIWSSKKYGINYKAIIEHLKPFPEDLSNYEIHHIKPLFTFNFIHKDGSTNLKEIQKAFAPENHKLLTIKEHKEIHRKLNHRRKKENV